MPAPAIKICGVHTAQALDAVLSAGADFAGFNFYPPSPRFLALASAPPLAQQADGRLRKVGVFVDATDAAIAEAIAAARLDAIQLHGSETPERAAQLGAQFGLPVWKVVSVTSQADLTRAEGYRGAAAFILLDAKTPKGTLPGGMGLTFDWALLEGWRAPLPWGLAGGLTPANVGEAVRRTGAPLVDAASGIESTPGVKDPALIAAFCTAARA